MASQFPDEIRDSLDPSNGSNGSLHTLSRPDESSAFAVEFRSALSDELITVMQQKEPCKAGMLQSHLAAVLCDSARPVLLCHGVALAPEDVLAEEVSLLVIRRPLPDDVAQRMRMAREAVARVKADELLNIKALKFPPDAMHDVWSATLLLSGWQDSSWASIKKFLGSGAGTGTRSLLTLEPYQVSFENQLAVQQIVKRAPQSFEYEHILKFSTATACCAALVVAFISCWDPESERKIAFSKSAFAF